MSGFKQVIVRPVLGAFALVAAAAAVAWILLPWPLVYRWRDPEATSVMQYRERQAAAEEDRAWVLRHEWVSLEDISPAVVRAVVAAEDGRFRDHGGVDWVALGEEVRYAGDGSFSWFDPEDARALADAVRYAWSHRAELRGRSTITQQLAKNLYFTPERSLGRKVAELVVAWRLEWLLSKDRILELYLTTVELGPGVFGVGAAGRAYFGTSASGLGTWEAATLAATLPHPLTSNPAHRPGRMAWRRDLILQRLRGPPSADRSPLPAAPPEPSPPGASGDTVGGADTLGRPPPDTGRIAPPNTVDTLRADTVDTLRADTVDTLRADTVDTVRLDTVGTVPADPVDARRIDTVHTETAAPRVRRIEKWEGGARSAGLAPGRADPQNRYSAEDRSSADVPARPAARSTGGSR